VAHATRHRSKTARGADRGEALRDHHLPQHRWSSRVGANLHTGRRAAGGHLSGGSAGRAHAASVEPRDAPVHTLGPWMPQLPRFYPLGGLLVELPLLLRCCLFQQFYLLFVLLVQNPLLPLDLILEHLAVAPLVLVRGAVQGLRFLPMELSEHLHPHAELLFEGSRIALFLLGDGIRGWKTSS